MGLFRLFADTPDRAVSDLPPDELHAFGSGAGLLPLVSQQVGALCPDLLHEAELGLSRRRDG